MVLAEVAAIVAGLVLVSGVIRDLPKAGPALAKAGKALSPFQGAIGVAAIVLGLVTFFGLKDLLMAATLVVAGLILAANLLKTLPEVGPSLEKAGKTLAPAQVPVGVAAIVLGLLSLFGVF